MREGEGNVAFCIIFRARVVRNLRTLSYQLNVIAHDLYKPLKL